MKSDRGAHACSYEIDIKYGWLRPQTLYYVWNFISESISRVTESVVDSGNSKRVGASATVESLAGGAGTTAVGRVGPLDKGVA